MVNSLVDNIIMPIVAIPFGKPNFNDALIITINDAQIRVGSFLTAVVSFLAIAATVFLLLKAYNKVTHGEATAPPNELVVLSGHPHRDARHARRPGGVGSADGGEPGASGGRRADQPEAGAPTLTGVPCSPRSSPTSGWWQATKWSGPISRSCGSSRRHTSVAAAQRVWNRQPGGGSTGEGISPAIGVGRDADDGIRLGDRVHQHLGVVVRRLLVERVARGDLAELAEVHHRDAVADVLDHGEVVGDEDQRQAVLGLEVLEQVEHLGLHAHVERATPARRR